MLTRPAVASMDLPAGFDDNRWEGTNLPVYYAIRHYRPVGLIEALIDWARTAGHDRLLLDVADTNLPAVRLYERMGFEPTGAVGSLPPPREHIREHGRALDLSQV